MASCLSDLSRPWSSVSTGYWTWPGIDGFPHHPGVCCFFSRVERGVVAYWYPFRLSTSVSYVLLRGWHVHTHSGTVLIEFNYTGARGVCVCHLLRVSWSHVPHGRAGIDYENSTQRHRHGYGMSMYMYR